MQTPIHIQSEEIISVAAKHVLGGHAPIIVATNEYYNFEVLPDQYWTDFFKKTTANGFNYFLKKYLRVKSAKYFTLCATINTPTEYKKAITKKRRKIVDDPHHTFSIGQSKTNYHVTKPGYLSLFANDNRWFYWNNKGSIQVKITRSHS
ncbi:hypothetical protein [Aquimarina agarilytica]|uniref:hypothetical protein n=1 Tax=Aquimarina agarilytica TaxID=1087449 RepID=UPI0002890A39|nr:hypothetical protein [Aquimarina agarilytica]